MIPFAVFDLDDTLVDYAGAIDASLVEVSEQLAIGPDGLAFLRAEQQRPVTPAESWQAIAERFLIAESPIELERAFAERVPMLCLPYDGAVAGMQALRRAGWRTALLTNGFEPHQRQKLQNGLEELFDAFCFADDEGTRKPDPSVFHLVAERAGHDLNGAWMIGNSLETDVAGAGAVGMSTIWVSGGAPLPPGGPQPDVIVATVAEAFPFLLREGAERGSGVSLSGRDRGRNGA